MGTECHHQEGAREGLAGGRLTEALGHAERLCTARDERLTTSRQRVLELLLRSNGPLKAYDLIAAFGQDGTPSKPPTVYRALEFLERQGFAHRIEGLNAYVPCRINGVGHRAAFLICDCCGAAKEFEPDSETQRAATTASGYKIRALTLEAYGLCPACQGR